MVLDMPASNHPSAVRHPQTAIQFIECPRDAMQGWPKLIPTQQKIEYLNALLKVGFDTLDFGSFVDPKVIPQMADTRQVLSQLEVAGSPTSLLAIVANIRGAVDAVGYDQITYLGYPFSVSETFQLRNTNKTLAQSLETVQAVQELCIKNNKHLVIYISMGFGNPYGDPYEVEVVMQWVARLAAMEIQVISLADTVGMADPANIAYLFSHLIPAFPAIEFGAHFHSAPHNWEEKISTAYLHGCRRFDSAIKGIGGCPMARDELVGNIATEHLYSFFEQKGVPCRLDPVWFEQAKSLADKVFS